jgi:hypothetical protein
MKRSVSLTLICALSAALFTILQGCGSNSSQIPAITPISTAPAPHPVTDLSELAPGNALEPFGKHDQAIARKVAAEAESGGPSDDSLGALTTVRHAGDDRHPCEQRLLNNKAARFDMLSMHLQDQVFDQVGKLQEEDAFSHLKLPTDLRPVIITATLNHQGVLKELVIDQHSGMAAVDKMVVAACKKGLYIHNAPAGAVDADGNYKVRLELRMENYASMDSEHWEFKTFMALAIL